MSLLIATCCAAGCESAGWNARLMDAFSGGTKATAEAEEQHRAGYTTNRNREDLYWLLANRIETSMTLREIGSILGEDGEREPRGQWIKQGDFRVDDQVYKFGPDNSGQSVWLVFRDGKLVNHNPEEFKMAPKKPS
ncbi:MAG: hypothetical protein NT069_09320 [Planctomycetota bacterium]|nr:hypothetical protein [Planctomycetota bacterium]